jgi:hypothetical protein
MGPQQIFSGLLACLIFSAGTQVAAPLDFPITEPKTSIEWFQRARDRMNIRMPGDAPFHMKVTFQALPGMEFLAENQKSQFVTGGGTYEETWLAPHKWRREVTLADYHGVEVESDQGRKMQASSEYEPIRVLMLLNALLNPIPRNLVSREFEGASSWTVDHLRKEDVSLVRISKTLEFSGTEFSDVFYFSPRGLLLLRNQQGLQTRWEDVSLFSGKPLPKHLSVTTGERNLLVADVAVELAGQIDATIFDLPGKPAESGTTLRPIQYFEIRIPELLSGPISTPTCDRCAVQIIGVIDRGGKYRELEVVLRLNIPNERELRALMNDLRKRRWRPPEIDRSPCEFIFSHGFDMRTVLANTKR